MRNLDPGITLCDLSQLIGRDQYVRVYLKRHRYTLPPQLIFNNKAMYLGFNDETVYNGYRSVQEIRMEPHLFAKPVLNVYLSCT